MAMLVSNPARPRAPARRGLRVPAGPGRASTASPSTLGSVVASIGEIRPLRQDNATLRRRERPAARRERPAPGVPDRERPADSRSSSAKNGFDFHTIAATVIARESAELGRIMTIDRGTSDGLAVGRRRHRRRRRARRTDHRRVGPTTAHVTLLSDPSSTVTGHDPGRSRDRRRRRPARQPARDGQHRRDGPGARSATRSSPPGSTSATGSARRTRRACLIGQVVDVQRDANAVVQIAFLTADRRPRQARVRPRHHRLPGRPAARRPGRARARPRPSGPCSGRRTTVGACYPDRR